MSDELAKDGKKIDFVIINADNAIDDVAKLISKCELPIFQDTATIKAWAEMGGGKDDFYVYDSTGKLAYYLPVSGGPVETNLGVDKNYKDLKALIEGVK